jgi:SAM-dependent methyltransferase
VVDAKELYTSKVDAYVAFNSAFRSSQAFEAYFRSDDQLRPDLRILSAGCGTGIDTLALVRALQRRGLGYRRIDAFDLTPAMLARFQGIIDAQHLANVHLKEANVLNPNSLPVEWANYDLIVSAAMLEYVPRASLVTALSTLRSRLAAQGRLLIFITRRNWITAPLIGKWWKANRYGADELRDALAAAGLSRVRFGKFPLSHFWHNQWAHVVEATRAGPR